MATLPDHVGPLVVSCTCGQTIHLVIPVSMRSLDKGRTVEVEFDEKVIATALTAHLRVHHAG